MAFIVRPILSPPQISSGGLHHHHHQWPSKPALLLLNNFNFSAALITPPVRVAQLNQPTPLPPPPPPPPPEVQDPDNSNSSNKNKEQRGRDEFYVNLGLAVRTLREDLPLLFSRDLNYHIYRDDITFLDPLNRFTGIDNYKLIFWALRFHGRILFSDISLEVFRVWQPSENVILIRWNLRGVPRVPWEAKGQFQGTSRYKLDRRGKIYEHKVDNLAFNFPLKQTPTTRRLSVLDLVAACPPSPNPTFQFSSSSSSSALSQSSSSWLELYVAVRETLLDHYHHPHPHPSLISQHCLATCSS